MGTKNDALSDEWQDDVMRERYEGATVWSELVRKKQNMYSNEVTRVQQDVLPALQRIVKRYSQQFGVPAANTLTSQTTPHIPESGEAKP